VKFIQKYIDKTYSTGSNSKGHKEEYVMAISFNSGLRKMFTENNMVRTDRKIIKPALKSIKNATSKIGYAISTISLGYSELLAQSINFPNDDIGPWAGFKDMRQDLGSSKFLKSLGYLGITTSAMIALEICAGHDSKALHPLFNETMPMFHRISETLQNLWSWKGALLTVGTLSCGLILKVFLGAAVGMDDHRPASEKMTID
jgi:hypothetical protein